jgi:hypothetical protein
MRVGLNGRGLNDPHLSVAKKVWRLFPNLMRDLAFLFELNFSPRDVWIFPGSQ